MPGGFPTFDLDICNGQSSAISASAGTAVIASATPNTMGAFTTLIAAAPIDVCMIGIGISNSGSVGGFGQFAVNIAVGAAGSEKVIISNLINDYSNVIAQTSFHLFPVSIPDGTRISVQGQTPNASDRCAVMITLYDGGFAQMEGCSGVDSIGFVAGSTQGTTVDAGATANTKGAYVALTAASLRDYEGISFFIDTLNNAPGNSADFLLDIAIGAAASEKVIIPNVMFRRSGTGGSIINRGSTFYPIKIPARTRIAARCQSSINTAGDRTFGLTAYGAWQ